MSSACGSSPAHAPGAGGLGDLARAARRRLHALAVGRRAGIHPHGRVGDGNPRLELLVQWRARRQARQRLGGALAPVHAAVLLAAAAHGGHAPKGEAGVLHFAQHGIQRVDPLRWRARERRRPRRPRGGRGRTMMAGEVTRLPSRCTPDSVPYSLSSSSNTTANRECGRQSSDTAVTFIDCVLQSNPRNSRPSAASPPAPPAPLDMVQTNRAGTRRHSQPLARRARIVLALSRPQPPAPDLRATPHIRECAADHGTSRAHGRLERARRRGRCAGAISAAGC